MPVSRDNHDQLGEYVTISVLPSTLDHDLPKELYYLYALDVPAALIAANSKNAQELEAALFYFLDNIERAYGQHKNVIEDALRELNESISTRLKSGLWDVRPRRPY